jgi:two-component system, NarL family, nitrate/nitrite response regulator NarL
VRGGGNRARGGGVPRSNESVRMAAAIIKVMVVGDDPGGRADLAARLAEERDCEVLGAFASADAYDAAAGDAQPDAIIWDLGEDSETGLSRLADAAELRIPIVVLVQDDRDGLRAFAAGAAGVLGNPAGAERIILAARTVLGGLVALDPSVAAAGAAVRDEAGGAGLWAPGGDVPPADLRFPDDRLGGRAATEYAPVETLTPREHDVLRLMAQGLGNKQIAERLGITEHTAKFHVHTILGKLNTQSRTEAVVRAARLGLIAI